MKTGERHTQCAFPHDRDHPENIHHESDKYCKDELGRLHVKCGKSGPLFLYNRATICNASNSESHGNDLYDMLSKPEIREGKTVCSIKSDGGTDWSAKSQHVLISQGRIWRYLDFDYYAIYDLAAGHSVDNDIEPKWAPLSKSLVSVTLPACLPDEDKPPCQQNISQEETMQKNTIVLDNNAIDVLGQYWSISHDGYPVKPTKVPCMEPNRQYSDYNVVGKFLKSSMTHIMNDQVFVEALY